MVSACVACSIVHVKAANQLQVAPVMTDNGSAQCQKSMQERKLHRLADIETCIHIEMSVERERERETHICAQRAEHEQQTSPIGESTHQQRIG